MSPVDSWAMSKIIHVRTEIEIPGHPSAIHVAEMRELVDEAPTSPAMCTMVRIIELAGSDSGETVTGAGVIGGNQEGLAVEPNETVPHPDTYADFPDITARLISAEEFEGLWMEAVTKFPQVE